MADGVAGDGFAHPGYEISGRDHPHIVEQLGLHGRQKWRSENGKGPTASPLMREPLGDPRSGGMSHAVLPFCREEGLVTIFYSDSERRKDFWSLEIWPCS